MQIFVGHASRSQCRNHDQRTCKLRLICTDLCKTSCMPSRRTPQLRQRNSIATLRSVPILRHTTRIRLFEHVSIAFRTPVDRFPPPSHKKIHPRSSTFEKTLNSLFTSFNRRPPFRKFVTEFAGLIPKIAPKVVNPRPPPNHFCSFLVASVDEFSKNGSTNEILGGAGVDDFFNRFQTGSTIGNESANTVMSTTFSIVLNRAKSRRLSTTFRTHAVSSDPTQNSGCRDKRDATRANCPA